MIVNFTIPNIINFYFIAAGIGICSLCFRQVAKSAFLRKEIRGYFQLFFLIINLYILSHLLRQLMEGQPGAGIHTALNVVTFIEMVAAGITAQMVSLVILVATRMEESRSRRLVIYLYVLLIVHVAIMVFGQINGSIFYFDAGNVYHRGSLYVLVNICPLLMILFDISMLVRFGKNMKRKVAIAFWLYTLLPLVAAVIQTFSYEIQYIIIVTVMASVYMFEVIIRDQTEEYERQQVEASRLDTELGMATRIQADMLPNIFPAFPEREEFDIYASMTPAKEVGGDFYDFFLIDDDHLGIVMADVSGKGVPAALFMMISKTIVQNFALTGRTPSEVLEKVNEQICSNNREEMFVTVWLGILNIKTGKLTAANAGHEYPALKNADGSFELLHDKHGVVIGAMPGMRYKEYDIELEPGAKLFLYTDGVAEATNADNELFGTDRMIEALRAREDGTPEELLNSVQGAVDAFVKEAPQFDDLTMLALEYKGESANSASQGNVKNEERS